MPKDKKKLPPRSNKPRTAAANAIATGSGQTLSPPSYGSTIQKADKYKYSSSKGDSIQDRMFADKKGNPVFDKKTMRKRLMYSEFQGAGSKKLQQAMFLLYQNPTGDTLKKALDDVAAARGLPREGLEQQFAKAQSIRKQGRERGKKKGKGDVSPDLDVGKHPAFTASVTQLRFGKIIGDVFNIDAVFGALISPTGGAVGPGNESIANADSENPTVLHGVVHDAAGYLYNAHGKGPGYNYLGASAELSTSNPLSGQSSGTAYWANKGRWGAGVSTVVNTVPNLLTAFRGAGTMVNAGVDMGHFASDNTTVAWLQQHTLQEVSKLPAKAKYQALSRMYSGYISKGDLNGMVKIIRASKISGDQATINAFFTEKRMRGMNSLSQRFKIYAELTKVGLTVKRPKAKKKKTNHFASDNSARAYLAKISVLETSKLSSAEKLTALKVLFAGYIGDGDLNGIVKVIESTAHSGDKWVAKQFFTKSRLNDIWYSSTKNAIKAALKSVGITP